MLFFTKWAPRKKKTPASTPDKSIQSFLKIYRGYTVYTTIASTTTLAASLYHANYVVQQILIREKTFSLTNLKIKRLNAKNLQKGEGKRNFLKLNIWAF